MVNPIYVNYFFLTFPLFKTFIEHYLTVDTVDLSWVLQLSCSSLLIELFDIKSAQDFFLILGKYKYDKLHHKISLKYPTRQKGHIISFLYLDCFNRTEYT